VIPASLTTSLDKQIAIMRDFKATALVSTPSHGVNLVAALEQMQIHPERLHLRLGLFGGERLSDSLRAQLEEQLRITAIDTYGLTEIMGPGVAGECHVREGFHVNEDHFIAEVVDPGTGEPVPVGREGELVLTTITKEGFPLIRYRTGDITSLNLSPCPCGRTFARVARITGRTDDLLLFRGVGFFPSQIEGILAEVEGTSPYYQIILDEQGGIDTIEIRVEISDKIPFLDEVKALEALRVQMARQIKTALDIEAKVTFVEPRSLRQLAAGKARVVDNRSR
jgi:phenylacetate-CoA ligase